MDYILDHAAVIALVLSTVALAATLALALYVYANRHTDYRD